MCPHPTLCCFVRVWGLVFNGTPVNIPKKGKCLLNKLFLSLDKNTHAPNMLNIMNNSWLRGVCLCPHPTCLLLCYGYTP